MYQKAYIIIIFISVFMVSGCARAITKPDGSVADQSKIQQISYDNYWQFFTFEDGSKYHEVILENNDEPEQSLKHCGGIKPQYSVLINEQDQTIASSLQLITSLNHLKNPEEAIAYLYATTCGLSGQFNLQQQFVDITDDGYLVSIIYYNWFGCGNHAHTRRVYFISLSGEIKLIDETKLEFGRNFCGD